MENNTFDACHPIALTPFYSKALHSFERILETWKTYWHGEKPYCAGTLFLKRKFNWQLDCHKWMSLYIEQQAFSFITSSRISSTGRDRKNAPYIAFNIYCIIFHCNHFDRFWICCVQECLGNSIMLCRRKFHICMKIQI